MAKGIKVPRITVKCDGCGIEFEKRITEVKERNFHNVDCGRKHGLKGRKGIEKICPSCNNSFYVKPSEEWRVTCSYECAGKNRIVERETRKCPECNTEFLARELEPRIYCSSKCAGNASVGVTEFICKNCGTGFVYRSSEPRLFCSKICFYEYQTEHAKGSITSDGYKVISLNGKLIKEHKIIMEKFLGRPLNKNENVHHKNGRRADNRIENLELWSVNQPSGQRVEDKVEWAAHILSQYAEFADRDKLEAAVGRMNKVLSGELKNPFAGIM